MSIYYFLFSKGRRECVNLGKKLDASERPFEGPIVWVDAVACFLPKKMLDLLIQRFYDAHPGGDVILLREDDLFESGEYIGMDDDVVEVGGDADGDPPLTGYLPELEWADVKAEIIADTSLRIS